MISLIISLQLFFRNFIGKLIVEFLSRRSKDSGKKLNNEFSDEISEEKLKADYERNHS